MISVKNNLGGSGGENLLTELDSQESLIDQIETAIEGRYSYVDEELTVTPTAEGLTVTPSSEDNLISKVTINGDEDLISSNIKSGVNIFGVDGDCVDPEHIPYVWGKYEVEHKYYAKQIDSIEDLSTSYLIEGDIDTATYYEASSYTFDKTTGMYTLVSPSTGGNLTKNYTSGTTLTSCKYIMFNSTSGDKIIFTGGTSGYNYVKAYWDSTGVYIKCPSTAQTHYIYSSYIRTTYNFIEYVTSDISSTYPNGDVHTDGYWYRYAVEGMYEWTKSSVETVIADTEESTSYVLTKGLDSGCLVVWNDEIYVLGGNSDGLYTRFWRLRDSDSAVVVGTLPNTFNYGSAVVYNDEIHILGGSGSTYHYKWNGTEWESVSTLPYKFWMACAVVYHDEIHILGSGSSGNEQKHYKWNGTEWESVSTLPFSINATYRGNAVIYNDSIYVIIRSSTTGTTAYSWNGIEWKTEFTISNEMYSAVSYENKIYMYGSVYRYSWDGNAVVRGDNLAGMSIEDYGGFVFNESVCISDYISIYYVEKHKNIYTEIDTVISNDELTYPYGDIHTDGYRYDFKTLGQFSKMTSGTYTVASDVSGTGISSTSITHGLNEIPKLIIVLLDNTVDKTSMGSTSYYYPVSWVYENYTYSTNVNQSNYISMVVKVGTTEQKYGYSASKVSSKITESKFTLATMYSYAGNSSTSVPDDSYQYLIAGTKYHWMAFA